MALSYRSSGLSWEQYLQANSFIKDINKTIRKSGKETRSTISEQTKQLVASNETLAKNFQHSFDQVDSAINDGFGMLKKQLEQQGSDITGAIWGVELAIEKLGARFEWGMSMLTHQLEIQNQLIGGIIEKLDAIHHTLQTPTLTQAREFYNIGRERLQKGFLDKALEAFLKAEEKNDVDFLTQYSLGHLYLYGRDQDCSIIDVSKAEKHFRCAARYAKPEIANFPEAKKFCGEAYFHASILYEAIILTFSISLNVWNLSVKSESNSSL